MRDLLDQALTSITWGGLVSDKTRHIMVRHAQRVLEVNQTFNLTRITDPQEVVIKHLIDSLWLIPVMEAWGLEKPQHYLDVGSGGGWPFVPLAAHFQKTQSWACEKTLKKAHFLQEICQEILPRARVFSQQIQELRQPKFDLVTLRAVGPLDKVFKQCAHVLKKRGVLVCYKGPMVEKELNSWRFTLKSLPFRELPIIEAQLPDGSQRVFIGAQLK